MNVERAHFILWSDSPTKDTGKVYDAGIYSTSNPTASEPERYPHVIFTIAAPTFAQARESIVAIVLSAIATE